MDQLSPEEIAEFREIFNLVDKDGGGSITKVELGELMDTLGIDASPEEIDQMIMETDQGMNVHLPAAEALIQVTLIFLFRRQRRY
jgi:Ca2+-binding EF-hand superfamily protein